MFAAIYLIGVFCAASFDITKWGEGMRYFVGFIGSTFAIGASSSYLLTEK